MKTKTRELNTYLGFPNNPKYWASSGWYTGKDVPDMLKLPMGLSWTQYWDDYYSNDAMAGAWQLFGATKAGTNIIVPSHESAYETITYESGRASMNMCDHRSFKAVSLPYTLAYGKEAFVGRPSILPFYRVKPERTGFPLRLIHMASGYAASSRAWHEMQPRFEGEISTINFLLELTDIKRLLHHGVKILNKIQNLPMIAYRSLRNVTRRGADPTRTIAELTLEKNLAIDPLLSDLSAIMCNLCTDVQDAQRMFKLKGEMGSTMHYSEPLYLDESLTPYGDAAKHFTKVGIRTKTSFTATMKFHYDYKLRGAADAFLKYWGLTGSAEALWNALPFSFLVDYFVKVGDAFHRMESDPNVRVFENAYCESLKTTTTVGNHYSPGSYWTHKKLWVDGGSEASVGTLLSGYESKLYTRTPCSPNKGAALPRAKVPGGKQMMNMAALARCFMS